ncbi:hypothetical protein YTPLAS18_00690 [Nitrospira sp.]|nr:hypothetical protein YTPLAS18_00690 [Nitrospira sp.]
MEHTETPARRLLSVEETACYLGLSQHTVYKMASQRRLPKTKIGGRLMFDRDELNAWIKTQTVMPLPHAS